MDRQDTNSRKLKRIAVVAIVGFALAALLYKIDGGGCNLLSWAAWFVLQLLHPVLLAGWHSLQPYVYDNSRLLQHLPDAVACIRPLLCAIGG